MNEKEICFYLQLSKKVKVAPCFWLIFIVICLANAQFRILPEIDVVVSLLASLFGLISLGESYYRNTDIAKCQKIIEKLVNSNPELIKKVNSHRRA